MIDTTLLKSGADPVFGPLKRGTAHTVDLTPMSAALLRQHKAAQATIKMRNRTIYNDLGLVFAREWEHVQSRTLGLGHPLPASTFDTTMDRLIKVAGVPRITAHGLRHTSATLLLGAGEPVHVVASRLGHSNATTTLTVYAHALPGHGRAAATTLSRLLHGNG